MSKDIIGLTDPINLLDLGYKADSRPYAEAVPFLNEKNAKHELFCADTLNLITHCKSRAKNISEEVDDRVVRLDTLYKLKTGPNTGRYMGTNFFSFKEYGGNSQIYAASEAPFSGEDFYRMVVDQNIRVIVSLSNQKDEYIATHQAEYQKLSPEKKARCERDGVSVELHHLVPKDQEDEYRKSCLEFDGNSVEYVTQTQPSDITQIIVKTYKVTTKNSSYHVKHIIYPNWIQYGASGSNGPLSIIQTINQVQEELFVAEGSDVKQKEDFVIAVNCVYGCGRTNTVILMHQLYYLTQQVINHRLKGLEKASQKHEALKQLDDQLEMAKTSAVAVYIRPMRLTLACNVISKAALKQIDEIKKFPEAIVRDMLDR